MDDRARYDPGSVPDPLSDIPTDVEGTGTTGGETEAFTDEYDNLNWEDLRRFDTKRMFIMIVVLGSLIGIGVGVGVSVNQKNKNNDNDSSTEASNPQADDFTLKVPPSNLEFMCSPTTLESQEGYAKCLHACQPSQCCELVDTNPFSCVTEYTDDCRTYHNACQHLQKKKVQDAAAGQDTVDQVCSTTSLSTPQGVKDCTNLCSQFMCCFPDKESNEYAPCSVSQAFCADYGACSALLYVDQDGFDTHQEATATIDEICTPDYSDQTDGYTIPTYEDTTECTNVCKPAQCCFVDQYDGDSLSGGDCGVDCGHYAACSVIYGDYHPDYDPDGNNDDIIDNDPKVDNEDDNGGDHGTGNMTGNTGGNTNTGTGGNTGGNTNTGGNSIDKDDILATLEIACSPTQLQKLDGVRNCMEQCQYHLCCFDIDSRTNCQETVGTDCTAHEPCRALLEHEVPIDSLEPMEQVCTYQEITTNGAQSCLRTCASHLCCTVDPLLRSSCLLNDIVTNDMIEDIACQEYEPCKMLAPKSMTTLDSELLLNLVSVHCTPEKVAATDDTGYPTGLEYCYNICQERACCWKDSATDPASCQLTDPEFCDEVSICQILFSAEYKDYDFSDFERMEDDDDPYYSGLMDDISVQLEKVCNPTSISTIAGFHECYDQCYYHLCCFINEYSDEAFLNCADDRPEECHEFSACSVLLASDVLDSTKEVVDEKCKGTQVDTTDGLHECHRYCAEHLCCFQDTDTESSCFGLMGMAECNEYRSCSFLTSTESHPDPNNHEDPFLITLVESACTSDKIATDVGREACRELCVKRACCFYDGSDNCFKENEDWCDEVVACEMIWDTPGTPTDDDDFTPRLNPLNEICNLATISTLKGFRECYDACYENMCCFIDEYSDEASLKCIDERPTECVEHAPCAILMTSDVGSATKEAVNERCVEANVGTADGFHECHRVCAEHLCCFQDEENPSYCVGLLGQSRCDHYRSCAFLMSTTEHPDPFAFEREDTNLAQNVKSACTLENVATEAGHEECRSHCVKRACCFFTGEDNCKADNPYWCNEIDSCENLFHPQAAKPAVTTSTSNFKGISPGPSSCDSTGGMTEEALRECADECDARRCCFVPASGGGCYTENILWCTEYETCDVVFGQLGGGDDINPEDFLANDGIIGPTGPKKCDDSAGDLSAEQLEVCKATCSPRECCFKRNDEGGCYSQEMSNWCEEYSKCELVYGQFGGL